MSSVFGPGDRGTAVRMALTRASQALAAGERRRAASGGLPASALAVLEPLADAVALPAGELGRRSGLGASALSHALRRHERAGLIERERQASDGRVVLVRLTRDGRRALQPVRAGQTRLVELLEDRFAPHELERLARDLERVAGALEGLPHDERPAGA